MIPTTKTLWLMGLGFPLALLPSLLIPAFWTVWLAFIGLSLLLVGMDGILAVPARRLEVSESLPGMLFIGDDGTMTVALSIGRWRVTTNVEILAELGDLLARQPLTRVEVVRAETAAAEVTLRPLRRGQAEVHALWLRWTGPFGLMSKHRRYPVDGSVAVSPNIRAVRGAALRFLSNREFLSGLKMQHYIGDGSEFEALEEFRKGLDHRAIDWKASARHIKLLVREFRAERNNQVYLAFDTGHLMSEPMDGIPKLDHAINAALLLVYACVKTGDRVGFFAFDNEARMFIEAQPGVQSVHRLQAHSAELRYNDAETNFTAGLTTLLTRLRRRSLVVVFTDFVDTVTAELMVDNIHRLARRHLVLFVTFRDRTVDDLVQERPDDLLVLNRAVVGAEFAREREVVLRRLQRLGVHCIQAPTDRMTVELINRYLEIKRREMV